MEVMSFNEQYRPYEGTRSGGVVKALLQKASQHNQELYQSQDTIKYCVCIRSNVQDILNYFSKDAQMLTGLNGSRSYGVRYHSNIAQISEGGLKLKSIRCGFLIMIMVIYGKFMWIMCRTLINSLGYVISEGRRYKYEYI